MTTLKKDEHSTRRTCKEKENRALWGPFSSKRTQIGPAEQEQRWHPVSTMWWKKIAQTAPGTRSESFCLGLSETLTDVNLTIQTALLSTSFGTYLQYTKLTVFGRVQENLTSWRYQQVYPLRTAPRDCNQHSLFWQQYRQSSIYLLCDPLIPDAGRLVMLGLGLHGRWCWTIPWEL